MIFFVGSNGTINKTVESTVYQGSDGANMIYLIAPFAENLSVTATFKLPNGLIAGPYAMSLFQELPEVINSDTGKPYYGCQLALDSAVTRYYGTVTAQFCYYTSNGKIRATSLAVFTVGQGVPQKLPENNPEPDIYQSILSNISELQEQLDNGAYVSRAIYEWNSTYTYGANEITFYNDDGNAKLGWLVRSKVADNKNNAPFIKGNDGLYTLNSQYWEELLDLSVTMLEPIKTTVTYQAGTSGTEVPTGDWTETIPDVPQGQYLWSKIDVQFPKASDVITQYSVAYQGINGDKGEDGFSFYQINLEPEQETALKVGDTVRDIQASQFLPENPPPQNGSMGITPTGKLCEIHEIFDTGEQTGEYYIVCTMAFADNADLKGYLKYQTKTSKDINIYSKAKGSYAKIGSYGDFKAGISSTDNLDDPFRGEDAYSGAGIHCDWDSGKVGQPQMFAGTIKGQDTYGMDVSETSRVRIGNINAPGHIQIDPENKSIHIIGPNKVVIGSDEGQQTEVRTYLKMAKQASVRGAGPSSVALQVQQGGIQLVDTGSEVDLSNGQIARGYQQITPIGGSLTAKQSGFYNNAYEQYAKYIQCGEGADKFNIGWEYSSGLHMHVYNSGQLAVDKLLTNTKGELLDKNGNVIEQGASGGSTKYKHYITVINGYGNANNPLGGNFYTLSFVIETDSPTPVLMGDGSGSSDNYDNWQKVAFWLRTNGFTLTTSSGVLNYFSCLPVSGGTSKWWYSSSGGNVTSSLAGLAVSGATVFLVNGDGHTYYEVSSSERTNAVKWSEIII